MPEHGEIVRWFCTRWIWQQPTELYPAHWLCHEKDRPIVRVFPPNKPSHSWLVEAGRVSVKVKGGDAEVRVFAIAEMYCSENKTQQPAEFSEKARKIFETIKAFFPPDPFGEAQYADEGRVYDNGWYDLRTKKDRARLMEKIENLIGYLVQRAATEFREKKGSLRGFTSRHFTPHMQKEVQLLLLLSDLDFQIETMDFFE